MGPSPEYIIREGNSLSTKKGREQMAKFGQKFESMGFDVNPFTGLFSKFFSVSRLEENANELVRVAKSVGLPHKRIIGGWLVPRILSGGEISWYSVLKITIKRRLEGDKNETLKSFHKNFGLSGIERGGGGGGEFERAKLTIKDKDGQEAGELNVFLPRAFTEEERVGDLAAIAMIPGPILSEFVELVLVRPDKGEGESRFLLISKRNHGIYISETDGYELKNSVLKVFVIDNIRPQANSSSENVC